MFGVTKGTWGKNIKWVLKDGTLTVTGSGSIEGRPSRSVPADKVRNADIRDGITGIGEEVFAGFSNMTELRIPDSVTRIGRGAFRECGHLKTVFYAGSKLRWSAITAESGNECLGRAELRCEKASDGSGTCGQDLKWILKDGVLTIGGTGEMCFPAPEFPPWCAAAEEITGVVILDGVTDIAAYAFWRCRNLADILIPASVKTIGKSVFKDCGRLTMVRYRGSAMEWNDILEFRDKQFREQGSDEGSPKAELRCEKAASGTCGEELGWTLEDGVLTVSGTGEMRFPDPRFSPWDAASAEITSAVIADGVTDIAANAFCHCGNLTEILIPAGVKTIGKNAFKGCDRLTTIRYRGSGIEWGHIQKFGDKPWWEQDEDLSGNAVLKKAELRCEEDASGTCGEELGWTLEDGVLTVSGTGEMRFPDPGSPPWYAAADAITGAVIADGVTDIGGNAFSLCGKLTAIRIPDSVISIGENAFSGCESLAEIHIPEGVTVIGKSAFFGCERLAEIHIPAGVTEIGEAAFSCCERLAEMRIPAGVKEIGGSAFLGCESLAEIHIPDGVTVIGKEAFSRCKSLAEIRIPDGVTDIGEAAFRDCESLAEIRIPAGVTDIGRSMFERCVSLAGIYIPDGAAAIGEYAFSGCFSLAGVCIPDSVTGIGEHAFFNCRRLTVIHIPDSVTDIGEHAFSGCKRLAGILIPAGVTYIAKSMFSGCKSLAVVCIPDGVTRMGENVFSWCKSLAQIYIPESVTEIGSFAFSGCISLAEIHIPAGVRNIKENTFKSCNDLKTVFYSGTREQWESISIESGNDCLQEAELRCEQDAG